MINTDQQNNKNRKISNIENLPWKTENVMQESNKQMNRIPACDILGVHIAAIDMNWLMQFTREHAEELSGEYICVSNVHTTVTAYDDPSYLTVQNSAVLAIPDGGPLSALGRKRGFPGMKRTTGPAYMENVLAESVRHGWTHYFYGSSKATTDKMVEEVRRRYPGIEIRGVLNPPFRELTVEEDQQAIQQINEAAPDFIWVGLGAPKQERWMYAHKGKVHGLMIGFGAAFDYLAGNIRRAPEWMQKANLEWLYRLFQDPRRLFWRYLYTNTRFLWKAVICGK